MALQGGVIKCHAASRLPDGEQWNADMIANLVGTPSELVPGKQSRNVPTAITEEGEVVGDEMEHQQSKTNRNEEDEVDGEVPRATPHNMHVSRKAVAKHGPTEGCPGCDAIAKRGHLFGKLGYNHNNACRSRIMTEMRDDPEYRRFMQTHMVEAELEQMEMISESQRHEQLSHLRKAIMTFEGKREQREAWCLRGQDHVKDVD